MLINQDLTGVDLINNVAFVKADATDLGKGTVPPSDLANPSSGPDPTVDPGTPTGIPVDHIHSVVAWKAYEVDGDATVTAVSGGETIEYFIFVRNTGNQDLTNVSIADVLPNGVTYVGFPKLRLFNFTKSLQINLNLNTLTRLFIAFKIR